MHALSYLLAARLKNTLRDLLRHPGRLLYVVVLVLLFLLAAVGSSGLESGSTRDPRELAAMGSGLFLLVFLLGLWNGFSKGGAIFSMADVNLLFPSPIRRTQALFYALLRLLVSLLVTVLGLVNKLPVIGTMNRGLGWLVGGATALLDLYLVLCILWGLIVITGGSLNVLNDTVMSTSLYYKVFNLFNPFL